MNAFHDAPLPIHAFCADGMEEALNMYLDGELATDAQPPLFVHLAGCDACRHTMSAVLAFRRMSRQESIRVPAAADDAFFHRLDRVKRRGERMDRAAQRRPLWQARAPVSLRAATAMALLLFLAGLFLPQPAGPSPSRARVQAVEERFMLAPAPPVRGEAVYVFYPGLTIEAQRLIETPQEGSL